MIKIGIVGGAGYTGGELLRILINHPEAEIVFVHSNSQAGQPVYSTHLDLVGETEMFFTNEFKLSTIDILFLCSGHGQTKIFLDKYKLPENLKLVDLSTDFRNESSGFVYGLPELNLERIKVADRIANPGCFATAIQLAILPLADAKLIKDEIHVSAVTGSTGAGQALSPSTHFSWRNNNTSIYKAFTHQHLLEINQSIDYLQTGFDHEINFIPYRGNFTRGIMANVYTKFDGSLEDAKVLYKKFYKNSKFTHVVEIPIDIKQVVNTNKCLIEIQKHGNKLLISTVIDNLLKGASGQAVQNMNIMFGIDEKTGLNLKSIGF